VDKERWLKFSWSEQLGNIGSEISRARHWEQKSDFETRNKALGRVFDLVDLTLDDPRWKNGNRLKELARFREVVSDWYSDQKIYDVPPESLQQYCLDGL